MHGIHVVNFILARCASIMTGTSKQIAVNSSPPGASCDLTRDGQPIGKVETPGNIEVAKSVYTSLWTAKRLTSAVKPLLAKTSNPVVRRKLLAAPLAALAVGCAAHADPLMMNPAANLSADSGNLRELKCDRKGRDWQRILSGRSQPTTICEDLVFPIVPKTIKMLVQETEKPQRGLSVPLGLWSFDNKRENVRPAPNAQFSRGRTRFVLFFEGYPAGLDGAAFRLISQYHGLRVIQESVTIQQVDVVKPLNEMLRKIYVEEVVDPDKGRTPRAIAAKMLMLDGLKPDLLSSFAIEVIDTASIAARGQKVANIMSEGFRATNANFNEATFAVLVEWRDALLRTISEVIDKHSAEPI